MTIASVLKVFLFILAGVALLAGFRSLLAGMRSRTAANKRYFNISRLEARRKVSQNMLTTIGLVMMALIFLVSALFVPDDFMGSVFADEEPVVEAGAESESAGVDGESAAESGAMDGASTESDPEIDSEMAEPATPEPVPTVTETAAPTPILDYIYVDSPIVGLYIRDLPDGDIIDVLDDRSRLSVNGDSELINGTSWVPVMTDEGREGWVAEQFTTDTPPAEPLPDNNLNPEDSTEEAENNG